ncbi:HNH endonuclease [Streptomyces griseoviridis]|uniref:HNH endonuclease n=1 Tax=Streptomyces griseoviridis TaxID=45398 RepID=UPI0013E38AA4|nr:HNH endonuclease [Streptomyces griseoviridis]
MYRSEIDFSTRCDLAARQKKVTSKEKGRTEWSAYRRSVKSKAVVDALRKMNGQRQRCVYCCDSRSADVDHFTPIAVDFSRTFSWNNFILVCPECNRKKSARFPVDTEGRPLVINPTLEDPWNFLVLDTKNGYLAARFLEEEFDLKGDITIEVISCVNHEAVVEGRRRVISRYYEAVESLLEHDSPASVVAKLMREVREDEYGVGEWFARREGREEPLFQELRNRFPMIWRRFVREVCRS